MGSIPVANPSPPRRWRFSRRVIPLAFLALVLVAVVAIGAAIVWPSDGGDSEWITVARAGDLRVNDPLLVEGDAYLVLLESGEILALSIIDSHLGAKSRSGRNSRFGVAPAGSGTSATVKRTTLRASATPGRADAAWIATKCAWRTATLR